MASYTPNYNLKKPADSDSYDIADHNGNMDKIDTALNTLSSNISRYNATSQDALTSIVNTAKLAPTGATIAFSGDSSTGTSLVGVAGVCFGNIKNVNASRMDYMVVQPSGGRIAVGTIDPSNNNAVTIVKVFS